MTDRLAEIRGRWANPRWDATAHHRADIAWLIAEVDRGRDIAAGLLEAPCGQCGQ